MCIRGLIIISFHLYYKVLKFNLQVQPIICAKSISNFPAELQMNYNIYKIRASSCNNLLLMQDFTKNTILYIEPTIQYNTTILYSPSQYS